MPADIVKLDRSFVAGIATDPGKAAIISAVLWLARALGMSVVAEGVEDEADAEMLAEQQCPHAPGFLFGRPMESTALIDYLPPIDASAPGITPLPGQRPAPLPAADSSSSARLRSAG